MAQNILSNQITVYPTTKRNDTIDRKARLYVEENIISSINSVADKESFIVSGLDLTNNSKGIKNGICIIAGYKFNFTFDISGSQTIYSLCGSDNDVFTSGSTNYLYFSISLKPTTISISQNDSFVNYELDGQDTSTEYTGLKIIVKSDNTLPTASDYYGNDSIPSGAIIKSLLIAYCPNDSQHQIAQNQKSQWLWEPALESVRKFEGTKIELSNIPASLSQVGAMTTTTLQEFIDNLIIDDGEI